MATEVRQENPHLALERVREYLFADPCQFGFFQAVRILNLQPGRTPVGGFANPSAESVRFGSLPSLSFPASEIQSLATQPGGPPKMAVNFFGLVGPLGVMPIYYNEILIARMREHDRSLAEFLDIFQHRLLSLFYRAWERYRFTVGYERDRNDPLTECLRNFVGLGSPGLERRQRIADESILFYGGFFSLIPRSAVGLESILSDYFDIPVEIEQCVGAWRRLDPTDQCALDMSADGSSQLGFGAVAGDEIWDRQSRVRIRLGPLHMDRYREFLPNGSAFEPLCALTRFYSGNDLEFELQLILKRDHVPACELGTADGDEAGPQLGWLTWMKSKPAFDRNPEDTILLLGEA